MEKSFGIKVCVFLTAMFATFVVHAYPGESITLNPATGDYTITYWNPELEPPGLETTTFIPATKIVPTIQSKLSTDRTGGVVYRYTVSNGAQSRQVLGLIILDPVDSVAGTRSTREMKRGTAADTAARMAVLRANEAALSTPVGWDGTITFGAGGRTDSSVRIGWDPTYNLALEKDGEGIKPGSTVRGFGFTSNALPDIIVAELSGDHPPRGWSGEGPPADSAILAQLDEIETHDFVPRNVAAPSIAIPVPFDAALLLDRIRSHIVTWPNKQLVESAFAVQLDRYLVSAADAYRRNQLKAGKEHIETLREMLKREHKDLDHDDDESESGKRGEKNDDHRAVNQRILIDRLAARILDFDLRYVLKRTEREDDDHKKH